MLPLCALALVGCGGGGNSGPNTGGGTGNGGGGAGAGTVPAAQKFFQQALEAFDKNQDFQAPAVKSNLALAIAQFEGALRANSNDSSANAGLATALFAQSLVEGEKQPFVGDLLDFSNSKLLGIDSVVALKTSGSNVGDSVLVKAVSAPLETVQTLTAVGQNKAVSNRLSTATIGQVQNYLSATEIPRLKRIQALLAKVNSAPTFSYTLYNQPGMGAGSGPRKLYGPDFKMIHGFVQLELGVAGTLTGYDLNPGSFYNNATNLRKFDANKDGRLTPAEYVAPGSFGKLRSDGAANLQLALQSLRGAAVTLEAGIEAESRFNAPADALISLDASQKASLRESLTFITQAKTALGGNATYPIDGATRTINISEFFLTPAADLRALLPTLVYRVSGGDEIIVNVLAAQDPKFSGVLPGGSGFLFRNLVNA